MEKQRLNMMSLKKSKLPNQKIISKYPNGPYYVLPMIDKHIINSAYQESTSVLSKYIQTQAKSFYEEALSFRDTLTKSKKKKGLSSQKEIYKTNLKTEANESVNKNKFYITAQDEISTDIKPNDTNEENQNSKVHLTEANEQKSKDKKKDSTISIDRILNKNQFKILNSTFHRLRTYQPKITKNWKLNNGVSIGQSKVNSFMPDDVDYQKNLFNDQFKLLVDNYQYYKSKILANEDFINAFKSLNLKAKIEFNKCLEEVCGLLILLPSNILAEFYKYIEYLKAPSKSNFKEKYIFDEVNCLYQNNKLLSEIFDYFKNSFEIYLLLVKEVDGMVLKQKEFEEAFSVFEKIRFDLSLICNIAENALINYTKDMGMIYKLNRYDNAQNKLSDITYLMKMKKYKSQSKNKERQRKLRIDDCLSNNKYNFINKNNKNFKDSRKFKSIIDSKFVSKLLGHCKKEIKYNIMTERINNEFDWNNNENVKIKNKPIKINF